MMYFMPPKNLYLIKNKLSCCLSSEFLRLCYVFVLLSEEFLNTNSHCTLQIDCDICDGFIAPNYSHTSDSTVLEINTARLNP
jgi:hypothetical protein